ncbi:DUF2339 domain-containing protein, partial [Mycobacterium ulcerans]
MTESQHAVISRLSAEFDSLARQMARVSGELSQLDRLISDSVGAPQPAAAAPPQPQPQPVAPYWYPYWQQWAPVAPAPAAAPPRQYAPPPTARPAPQGPPAPAPPAAP